LNEGGAIQIGVTRVGLGERLDTVFEVSQNYTGVPVVIPVTVWRAPRPGPIVFVTAAVHGDELNGTGIVREMLLNQPFELQAGSLILLPVVNMLGLERHQRYLPDRRDLNRSFPGAPDGSLARRFAHAIFDGIIRQCDFGIDLHTAAVRKTNYPNVRADLRDPAVKALAYSLGSELIVNGKGPAGSLRRAACAIGCPTVIIEAGEVWKIEPSVVDFGVRAIASALSALGMIADAPVRAACQVRIDRTKWVRAERGGILQFHVAPGDIVEQDQPLTTNADLHAHEQHVTVSPADGVVIGMTTLPFVTPGDAVCHIAIPKMKTDRLREARADLSDTSLGFRLLDDLSTSVSVTDADEGSQPDN